MQQLWKDMRAFKGASITGAGSSSGGSGGGGGGSNSNDAPASPAANSLQLGVVDERRGLREGEEADKVLGWYPAGVGERAQVSAAGLLLGLVQMASMFEAASDCAAMGTDHARWAAVRCEPGVWLLLIVPRAWHAAEVSSDGMLQRALRRVHGVLCAVHGRLQALLDVDPSGEHARHALAATLPWVGSQLARPGPGPRLSELLSPVSPAEGLPFLRPSQKTALSVQCLCDSLQLATYRGCQPVQAVVLAYESHRLLWSGLGREDSLRVADLLSALQQPKGRKTVLRHTLGPVGSSGSGSSGGNGGMALEWVWLQDGSERLRLATHRHGPLLIALLLSDDGLRESSGSGGNAAASSSSSTTAAATAGAGSDAGGGGDAVAEAAVDAIIGGCSHMVASLVEMLADEMPEIGSWHAKGYRYVVYDALPFSSVSTPAPKVFGATSHSSAALLAAVRGEEERFVLGPLSSPAATSAAAADSQTADHVGGVGVGGGGGGDGTAVGAGHNGAGPSDAASGSSSAVAAQAGALGAGAAIQPPSPPRTGDAARSQPPPAPPPETLLHAPEHELLVEASSGSWVGAMRRDSRSLYAVLDKSKGGSSSSEGGALPGAGALLGRLFLQPPVSVQRAP